MCKGVDIRFRRKIEKDRLKMISNRSCVGTAPYGSNGKELSIQSGPFHVQHETFKTEELHPPVNERLAFGLK